MRSRSRSTGFAHRETVRLGRSVFEGDHVRIFLDSLFIAGELTVAGLVCKGAAASAPDGGSKGSADSSPGQANLAGTTCLTGFVTVGVSPEC